MDCTWIGNRVLIVEQISYFLLSVMSVLLLCSNFSYMYSPTNAEDTSRKIPRASQFLLKSELIIYVLSSLCVYYTQGSPVEIQTPVDYWRPDP
jgi:hypothetical protein